MRALVLTGAFVAVVGLAASTVGAAQTAQAGAAAPEQTVFVTTGFTGPTAAGYIRPSAPIGSNVACLTAGTDLAAAVPGCAAPAVDASGDGALRLTSAGYTLEGGVGSTQSIPISKGLDASFDSYQYGGNGADGIVFYLAATDPYNPQVPTAIGQAGGSLGYSATGSSPGLAHGYLGLGLDAYGNYLNSSVDGTGCSTAPSHATQPSNVTVRGPGNGASGYCVLPGYNATIGGRTALEGTTRAASNVPVEVVINPATTSTTSAGTSKVPAVTVAARSFAIVLTTIGATSPTVVTGTLPDLRDSAYSGLFPSSWYDPATGLPYKLTYGWVASTGGSTDVHEVNHLTAQTLNGPVPTLTASSAVSSPAPAVGSVDTVTISPAVAATGGSETQPVQVTTTFPSGVIPTAYTGSDYRCSISGQTETCTDAGTTPAGSALPPLTLPFTAAGPVSSTPATISAVVSSVDATAVTTSSSFTISGIPTTTTVAVSPSPVDHNATETITATVTPSSTTPSSTTPSSTTGTVAFVDTTTGTVLCPAATVTAGVATCTVVATGPIGAHTVSATFSGDATSLPSTGTTSVTVQRAASTIGVTASPAATSYGTASTMTATGVPVDATGTLTFADADGTMLCTVTLPTSSCATPTDLPAGTHQVSATYSGDGDHAPATSAAVTLQVTRVGVTTLGSTVNGLAEAAVVHGGAAELDTTGVPSEATGTITYETADGTALCTATLPGTSCTTATDLAGGTYQVTAHYSGDSSHDDAVGPSVTLRVTPQAVVVTARGAAAAHGSQSSTTLTVTGVPAGATGTVTFTGDGHRLCTATLPDTSCSTTVLPAGTHAVVAAYSGDASYAASRSMLTVTVPPTSATVPPTSATAPPTSGTVAPSRPTRPTAPPARSTTGTVLAFTGSGSGVAVIGVSALLLTLGAALRFAARRRRRHAAR